MRTDFFVGRFKSQPVTLLVKPEGPFELPIRMDSGDAKEFYVLFPMSVTDKLEISFMKLMRSIEL